MIPFPKKKYNIIYADPAWTFSTWSEKAQRKVSDHYDVMKAEDIYNFNPIYKKSGKLIHRFFYLPKERKYFTNK